MHDTKAKTRNSEHCTPQLRVDKRSQENLLEKIYNLKSRFFNLFLTKNFKNQAKKKIIIRRENIQVQTYKN